MRDSSEADFLLTFLPPLISLASGTIGFRKSIKIGGPEDVMPEEQMRDHTSPPRELPDPPPPVQQPPPPQPQPPPPQQAVSPPRMDHGFSGLNLVKEPTAAPPPPPPPPPSNLPPPPVNYGSQPMMGHHPPHRPLMPQQQQQEPPTLQETYNTVSSLFQLPGTQYFY